MKIEARGTDGTAGAGTLERIREAHAGYPLLGDRPGRVLGLDDTELRYVIGMLRDENPEPPLLTPGNWTGMLSILERHRILPLIAKRASKAPAMQGLPDAVRAGMKNSYLQATAQALYRERTLKEIIPAFERTGVDVLVLKGAAMAYYAYPDPVLRQGSDIDLLISPGDVLKAGAALEGMGYRCRQKNFDVSSRRNHEMVYMYATPSMKHPPVELHWNLFPFFMFNQQADLGPLFGRAVTVDGNGFSFRAMHPADALCHEATHMIYGHKAEIRLSWILDVGMLCRKLEGPQDWTLLQRTSVDYLSRLALEKSFRMAQAWTGLQVPGEFEDFSRWPRPSRRETYFSSYYATGNPASGMMLALSGGGSPGSTLGELRQHAFPSPEVMRARYPGLGSWPLALLYVRRWLKLIANR